MGIFLPVIEYYKDYHNIFKLFLIKWTKTIKAGDGSTVETFSTKKRKLNYTVHNPNTVEDTANYLLKVLIEANENKVETAIQNSVGLEREQPGKNIPLRAIIGMRNLQAHDYE